MIPNITTGADFGDLVTYLVENRDHEVIDLQGVSSIDLAADEMSAVAALSSRAKVKLVHLSISAAHEDGSLSSERWLDVANQMEHASGLKGHQRVVVRHRDKTHDHIHIFWCTISAETGCTPPKQWFLRKGFAVDDVGPNALTEEQVARVPVEQRARRTYDFILLRRTQHLCRRLERELGLRELRSPEQAAEARRAGEERAPAVGQTKRAERVGSRPLMDETDAIRQALDYPDWSSKRHALLAMGLDIEPVTRTTSKGEQLRGVVIFDRADLGNRMKASQLDTPAKKYGLRQLEGRHLADSDSFEAWWPKRGAVPFSLQPETIGPTALLREEFKRLVERHRLTEADKQAKRRALRSRQKVEISRLRVGLMRQRAAEAAKLEPAQRRQLYADFQAHVRRPALQELAQRHLSQGLQLVRSRKPIWIELFGASLELPTRDTPVLEMAIAELRVPLSVADKMLSRSIARPAPQHTDPARAVEVSTVLRDERPRPGVATSDDGISPALATAFDAKTRRGGR